MDIADFSTTQLALLTTERNADITQQTTLISQLPPTALVRHGLAITNLLPASQRTGFGGRTILELEPDNAIVSDGKIPPHGVRQGDIVRVEVQPGGSATKKEKSELSDNGVEGVVHRVFEGRIAVSVSPKSDDGGGVDRVLTAGKRLWVVKLANEVTFSRMEKTMGLLKGIGESGGGSGLVDVLFGRRTPAVLKSGHEREDISWFDGGLNDSQKEAVGFALASPEVALIHGPPGTGKTQTLLELILQLVTPPPSSSGEPATPKKILVCGPSNISVDNIVLRLPAALPIIRLGHPARLLPRVLERSLDALTRTSEAGEIVSDVRREMDDLLSKLNAAGKSRIKGKARKDGWSQVRDLRGEYRRREDKCVTEVVRGSKVVLCTLHGAGSRQILSEKFDVVIIDEGSQALEAQCWIPLLMTRGGVQKLVIAGDPMQLPPTIKSVTGSMSAPVLDKPAHKTEVPDSLEVTLFSRLLTLHGEGIKRLLDTQYRMHADIMAFPSKELYGGLLIAHESVKEHLLTTLPYEVQETEDTAAPVVFIDTQGGEFPEDVAGDPVKSKAVALASESRSNLLEARLVALHVKALIDAGVREGDVGVLTPYNAQVALISKFLREAYPGVEVNSVDSFQGREKEAVVISLVRSNEKRETGFLKDVRRINVAVTRARRHLCVVGDSETVGRERGFLRRWMEWLGDEAVVRYPDVGDVLGGWVAGLNVVE
ncbi:uncharacterized protein LAJ45_00187 [Morchella importuna]|uniref:uncharacterized protein n=1 Tax=Morchella importuna TaxID=1174673 RepID=UPI001E8D1F2F|nr:uncharacterized protein LAJ45_00187 [Morchella importuna]KAH8155178.1 hypothetical protein LAJ45_00187 [Morchella importuna]